VEVFLEDLPEAPKEIILDLDATTIRCTGTRRRFFHGYYGNYCTYRCIIFLPESSVVCAVAIIDIDARRGSVEELQRIVAQIVPRAPGAHDGARGSGFCREELMAWCERTA